MIQESTTYAGPPCRFCGKPLRGRSDKLYCDANCKNEYHNRYQRQQQKEIDQIDRILKRNRRVLKTSLGSASTRKVSKMELVQEGLRFDYYTHHYTNTRQEQYCFCYDYGYLKLNDEQYLVVKSQRSGFITINTRMTL